MLFIAEKVHVQNKKDLYLGVNNVGVKVLHPLMFQHQVLHPGDRTVLTGYRSAQEPIATPLFDLIVIQQINKINEFLSICKEGKRFH